ncbi:zinc finger protein 655 isoform X3 [Fundulus heteroclitus]|uniref:zinc finger protein 655 isoform X3 n=1 Tax=Fundulus heteroclitus TaxID=8078 RepID=UPI00165C4807|nr:zinc finger protein 655 isoform X3 [Fundulus heteroclitus]
MSSPWRQEEVNDEHLTPTAETFTELKEIIVKSEEEIDGERRLLDFNRLPQIIVHQIDPQHHVEKEEAPVDLQLWPQQRNSKAGQEEIDPLQIKEEQKELEHLQIKEEEDELCISQDEAQIVLKQETETFMVTSNYEGKYLIEPEQNWNQGISQDTPEADQDGSSEEDSGSETDEEQIQNKRCQHNDSVDDSEQKSVCSCKICVKIIPQNSFLTRHGGNPSREKPFSCLTSGKSFSQKTFLKKHSQTKISFGSSRPAPVWTSSLRGRDARCKEHGRRPPARVCLHRTSALTCLQRPTALHRPPALACLQQHEQESAVEIHLLA